LYDRLFPIREGVKIPLPSTSVFPLPEAFSAEKAALTFVCNPTSPSGTLLPLNDIERLARSSAGAVVVDEAYIDFSDVSATALPLLKQFANLIVLRAL